MKLRTAIITLTALQSLAAVAQTMPLPEFKVGDRWVYRETDLLTKQETGKLGETVRAIEADTVWFGRRTGVSSWARVDPRTAVMREQQLATGPTPAERGRAIASNDGGCAYPWPLQVGQSFDCVELTTWPNGLRVRYDLSFKVEAYESVEVPAGRFDAFRLVARGNYLSETQNVRGTHHRVVWLAPAVKRELKSEIRSLLLNSSQPNRVEGRELLEFTPGGIK